MTEHEHRLCQDLADRQAALLELIAATRHDLLFFAPRLEGRLLEASAVHQTLQKYLLSGPRHRIRLLTADTAALVRDCPRLVALCRRLPSRCLLRVPTLDAEPLDEAAYLADRPYLLHRSAGERVLHRYIAADPQTIAVVRQRIESTWEYARPSPEFRDLVI